MLALSAGHNAAAPGACWDGRCEHPEALKWVELVLGYIGTQIPTLMVLPVSLGAKVKAINDARAKLAVEIHFNSAGGHGQGYETLYAPGSALGFEAATIIHRAFDGIFHPDRGIKEGWHRMDIPGVVDYPGDVDGDEKIDYFLKATHCPAVIVEPEFVHRWGVVDFNREAACKALAERLIEAYESVTS